MTDEPKEKTRADRAMELREKFFNYCQTTIEDAETLDLDEARQIRDIFANPTFLKACTMVFYETRIAGTRVLGLDLSKEENVIKASQIQGHASGLTRCFEFLWELVINAERLGEQDDVRTE